MEGSGEDSFPRAAPAGARTIRIETPAPPPARRTPIEAVGTGVLEEIERFNRRHREVYAVLKGSVGSGARNLVANCAKRLGEGAQIFAGLAMDETGAFPAELLFERVGEQAPARIRAALEALIGAELRISEGMLDGATVKRLEKRLEAAGSGLVEPRRR